MICLKVLFAGKGPVVKILAKLFEILNRAEMFCVLEGCIHNLFRTVAAVVLKSPSKVSIESDTACSSDQ